MPPAAPAPRRPRFTIDDSDDPSESEPEHDHDQPREGGRPRRVPAIVVEDAGQAPSSREDEPAGARDLDREEKHVGFAAGPDLVTVGGGGGSDEEGARAVDPEAGRAEGYPPAPRRASSDTTSHRHGESSDETAATATAPPSKDEVDGKGFDRPEFAQPPETTPPALKRKLPPLPGLLAWVKPHLNWKGFRPVIRASVASWCGLLLSASFSPPHPRTTCQRFF